MVSPDSLSSRKATMLFLVFQIGKDRYAIEASQVVEVLPLVNVKHVPQAVVGVAGIFDYHGAPVPLIDLAELALGMPGSALATVTALAVTASATARKTYGRFMVPPNVSRWWDI